MDNLKYLVERLIKDDEDSFSLILFTFLLSLLFAIITTSGVTGSLNLPKAISELGAMLSNIGFFGAIIELFSPNYWEFRLANFLSITYMIFFVYNRYFILFKIIIF